MAHMGDGIGVVLDKVTKDKCPICEKDKHDTTKDKKEKKGCLESFPKNLGCSAIPIDPTLPNYTTAAHHLIPIQCLASFLRLSQMCDAVGYDVNNPQNGLSLPTVGQKKFNRYTAKGIKYGKLKESDKKKVAFIIMEGLALQWHVGHHKWSAAGIDETTDTENHSENYNKLVKLLLRDLERDFKEAGTNICDPKKEEKGAEIIADMNATSSLIEGNVMLWSDFFVSKLAYSFARKYQV